MCVVVYSAPFIDGLGGFTATFLDGSGAWPEKVEIVTNLS